MFHFDWTINVGTVSSVLMLLGAIINYGHKVVQYLKAMSFRVTVMWNQFEKEHPDLIEQIKLADPSIR